MLEIITKPFLAVTTYLPVSHILLLVLGWGILLVINRYFYQPSISPFKNLPGPNRKEPLWNPMVGHLKPIIKGLPAEATLDWIGRYGTVFQYEGLFGRPRISINDPVATQYVLNNTHIFQKDDLTRTFLSRLLGNGLLNVEGADHKRQRKIMNPAFSSNLLKDHHLPIFYDKAYILKTVLDSKIGEGLNVESVHEKIIAPSARLDISKYLSKATLDVIGLAGFGYDFDSMRNPANELACALEKMFSGGRPPRLSHIVVEFIPGGRFIPSTNRDNQKKSLETTTKIGRQLVEGMKQAVRLGEASIEKGKGKDLLSMVVRANMDPSLAENQRMSDAEVIATIQTFVLAGAETSSTALTWSSCVLAQNPEMQRRLREECQAVSDDRPSLDTLNGLPYLEAFIHEILRLHAPVPQTRRDAVVPAIIPLGKPVMGRDGSMIDSVTVSKGTPLMLGILSMHKNADIWGSDVLEFNPDRWLNASKTAASETLPGVWGNLLTFIGGPRACIGFRFSLIEIKVMLFVLIRNFAFGEAVSREDIVPKTALVTRPHIRGEEQSGPQMPIILSPLAQ